MRPKNRIRPEAEWTHVDDPAIGRARGALWGAFVGDALAMPVHWYYDRAALRRDYGRVTGYLAPKNPHPDSVLWRSRYVAAGPESEILHDQARYWGQHGVHYHQFLQPGENTLNLKLAALLADSLAASRRYDADDYLARYIDFMTTPGRHADTYIEECHRGFFANRARGVAPRECGIADIHIGGLAAVPVLAVYLRRDPTAALAAVREHVALTHRSPEVLAAAEHLASLLLDLMAGAEPVGAIDATADLPGGPGAKRLASLAARGVDEVIGVVLSPACYIREAWPAVLYLARTHATRFRDGLIANTMAGGDNCHRGAALGAILGAACGDASIPADWAAGLKEAGRYHRLFEQLTVTV